MSTYRIFVNNLRVATAACLSDGSYLQTYPERKVFPTQDIWVRETFWANREGRPRSYSLQFPDGSTTTYLSGRYTLFHDNKCVSAGYNVGVVYVQRYPYFAMGTRTELVSERAPIFGVSTELRVKSKVPVVTAAPEPKERVSRWTKMTQQEREDWKNKMRMARILKDKRFFDNEPAPSVGLQAVRALGEQSIMAQDEVRFVSVRDYMREQERCSSPYEDVEDDSEDEYYGEKDFEEMHPAIAMVLRHLTETYGPTRKSHEPCDCGMC